jgi:hypothetical protein
MRTGKIENSNINNLMQVVYDSGELTVATTSITISGLNGDADEEYILINRFVGGCESYYRLRLNNDTAENYGQQTLIASSTDAAANRGTQYYIYLGYVSTNNELDISETIIHAKSGYVRTGISKIVTIIRNTGVQQILLRAESWNNTADNLTSLVVYASATDGIGIGSRIILLKKVKLSSGLKTGDLNIQGIIKGTWQEIYNTTLVAAASSITISGLTGNTDILYRLKTRIVAGASTAPMWKINNDTGSNYDMQLLNINNTTINAYGPYNNNKIYFDVWDGMTIGQIQQSEVLIYIKSGYVRTFISKVSNGIATTTIGAIEFQGGIWRNTTDEITSLVITGNPATDCLGIGTYISLERLNL